MNDSQLCGFFQQSNICSNAKPIIEWQRNTEEETSSGKDEVWWITSQSVNLLQ